MRLLRAGHASDHNNDRLVKKKWKSALNRTMPWLFTFSSEEVMTERVSRPWSPGTIPISFPGSHHFSVPRSPGERVALIYNEEDTF